MVNHIDHLCNFIIWVFNIVGMFKTSIIILIFDLFNKESIMFKTIIYQKLQKKNEIYQT